MKYNHKTRKRQNLVRLVLCVLMCLLGLAAMTLFSPAWADVVCGSTIGPHQTVTLQNDIECDAEAVAAALTVTGPATLDLNGHTVSCNNCAVRYGIFVEGSRVRIYNGTVMNFNRGIILNEDDAGGWHKVEKVTVDSNNRGIVVGPNSKKNHLYYNIAVNNVRGFRVEGDWNRLDWNKALNNENENYQIRGDKNRLENNIAYGTADECFLIQGNMNWFLDNIAIDCGLGFVLSIEEEGGDYNKIWNCTAIGNAGDEIDDGVGVLAEEGTKGNLIFNNTVWLNELYDVQDANGDCKNNKWRKNNFGTSYPDCIK